MNEKEVIEQLESLIEAWQLDEADLNQTDINAIKKMLHKNKQLKDNWNKLRDYLFDIRHSGFELQNLAGIHNTEPAISVLMILDKMQELEKGDSNDR